VGLLLFWRRLLWVVWLLSWVWFLLCVGFLFWWGVGLVGGLVDCVWDIIVVVLGSVNFS
jgi:hypothetical protein